MKKLYLFLLSFAFIGGWGTSFGQVSSYPYVEDFDSWSICGTACGSACGSSNGWTQDATDDIDWTFISNGTGSSNTGPSADHTSGSGIYGYTEASGCANDIARLNSPEFDFSNLGSASGLDLTFWYHMFGATINEISVDFRRIQNGTPDAWSQMWSLNGAQGNAWMQAQIGLDSLVGDTVQFRIVGVTGGSFTSDAAIDDFMIETVFALDAAITAIDSPVNPITAGTHQVYATLTNFGVDTLVSDSIGWSANGVVQGCVPYSGSLARTQSSSPLLLGSYAFANGFTEICAWNKNPNDSTDQNPGNDTICMSICTPFNGTFTIGGASPDWNNFTEASSALMQCGIDGPVTINVMPGVYMETLNLGEIPGASAVNTVTFNGMDTAMVTLSNASGPTVYFDGTDYVTIRNITIEALATIDCYGVQMRDSATWNWVDSCRIVMDQTATNMSDVIGVSASNTTTSSFSEGLNAYWFTLSNSTIIGGEKGVHFEGSNASRNEGNRFINNMIMNVEDYGFYMDDQDSLLIEGNTVMGVRAAFGDGIYCFDIQMFNISGNTCLDIPDWGLYVADGNFAIDGTPSSRGRIVNNMVSSLSDYAIYFDDFEQTDIFHNTAYGNPGIRINDYTGLDIRNNVFQSDGDYAFEADEPSTNTPNTLNYNCYWTPVSNGLFIQDGFGITPADLPAWQLLVAANNANSVEGDPVFIGGTSDLHALGLAPNDAGDNTVGVIFDVDGETRPGGLATIVDIGADEYTPRQNDAVMLELLAPAGVQCGDSTTEVIVAIKNQGIIPITSLPITVNFTGDIVQTLNLTYTDTLNFNELDTVSLGTVNTYGGGFVTIDGRVDLSMDEDSTNDFLTPFAAQFTPVVPQVIDGYGCGTDSALISGATWPGAAYNFYASATDTVPVATGQSYMIPSLTTQSTYYVEYANNKDSLETTFAQNNGCTFGNMFDITATNTITINSWVGHLASGAGVNQTVDIYYKVGTYATDISNAAAWTLLGTVIVPSGGIGTPVPVDVGNALTIPAGATYGIYFATNVRYTNGSQVFSNPDMTISTGYGHCSLFSSGINGRIWNGRVIYGSTSCGTDRVPVTAQVGVPASLDIAGDTTLCATSYTLDAGNPGGDFLWSTGETTSSITVMTSGNYSVAMTDSNGCAAWDSAAVTIYAPISTNIGPDTLLCDGASVMLDAGNPGASFVWMPAGTTQTITAALEGMVSVVVTDSNGCTATDTMSITTAVTPTAAFTFLASGAGLTYDFTDASMGSPSSWAWDFGDGMGTSTMQNPTYTYAADGSYTVSLTVTTACGTNTITQSLNVVGMEEILLGGTVTLYPNPSNGRFALSFEGIAADQVEVQIMDLLGHVIEVQELQTAAGTSVHDFDITRLSKGIYQVRVSAQGQSAIYKAVIE